MNADKEYVISIPKRDAEQLWELCLMIATRQGRLPDRPVPKKFEDAMAGLACRFQVPRRKRPVYKMSDAHLNGLLDVIGGFYCSANLMREKDYDGWKHTYNDALRLMRTATRIENQARKQGFVPFEPPKAPPKLRLV